MPSTPSSPDAADSARRLSRGALIALVVCSVALPLGLLVTILVVNRDSGTSDPVASGCESGTDTLAGPTPSTVATPDRGAVGDLAPDFVLLTLDECGREQLSAHRGTPVVLTFFASWCHPCEQEMPLLEAAHAEQPGAFDVLAVTYEDFRPDATRFTDRLGVTYPALFDTDGAVADRYGVSGIPQTWFIDANGVVRDRVYGITSEAALAEPLDALLQP